MDWTFSQPIPITPITTHHFFGYYGVCPWSVDGRWFVCLETSFHNRMPKQGESANVILIECKSGNSKVITTTLAWNFQQGSMLNWLPSSPNSQIILNDVSPETGKLATKIIDINTEKIRWISRPINAVAHTHNWALSVNYDRFRQERQVISYSYEYPFPDNRPHSPKDGIFFMDLDTNETRLLISYDKLWHMNPRTLNLAKEQEITNEEDFPPMRIDHVVFSPNDSRFLLVARYSTVFNAFNTAMWTLNTNGEEPFLAVNYDEGLSHFEWIDEKNLIVTQDFPENLQSFEHYQKKDLIQVSGSKPKFCKRHVQIQDQDGARKIIAPKFLKVDGHPTMHPTGKAFATDTYIIQGHRYIYLIDLDTMQKHEIASFPNPPEINGNWRCDPHPRWNRDGTQLAFDGLGSNGRQVYTVKVSWK